MLRNTQKSHLKQHRSKPQGGYIFHHPLGLRFARANYLAACPIPGQDTQKIVQWRDWKKPVNTKKSNGKEIKDGGTELRGAFREVVFESK